MLFFLCCFELGVYTEQMDRWTCSACYTVCLIVYCAVQEEPLAVEHELVMTVRKELAIALRDLLQHGLMEVSSSYSCLVVWFIICRSIGS